MEGRDPGDSLARVEDPEELKRRYRCVSGPVLRKWMAAVKGAHREAMAAVLAEREEGPAPGEK